MKRKLILGTRGSELALWQANFIMKELAKAGHKAELKVIKTKGDLQQEQRFSEIEGQGFFTKEIEEALRKKEIDLAVHSYKDMPTTPVKDLMVGAVSYREDPSELLLINKESVDRNMKFYLKRNAVVGTSAARRMVQFLALRPDAVVKELRGNVHTRLKKLQSGMYDAIFLAVAAVNRLNLDVSAFHAVKLSPQEFMPAPAQGVLALQVRENDAALLTVLKALNHLDVEEAVGVERKIFSLFRGGCNLPLGIYCEKHADESDKPFFKIFAAYSSEVKDYPRYYYFQTALPTGWDKKLSDRIRLNKPCSVFITRDIKDDDFFSRSLKANGYKVSGRSFIEFKPIPFGTVPATDWIFFSSKHAVTYFFDRKPETGNAKLGAIGKSTAEALRSYGRRADFIGASTDTRLIGKQFASLIKSGRALFPQAKDSMRTVQQQFVNKEQVLDLSVYETISKPVEDTPYSDIILFTSPSNAEAFLEKKRLKSEQKIIAMGDATAHTLKKAGYPSVYHVPSYDEIGLLMAVYSI